MIHECFQDRSKVQIAEVRRCDGVASVVLIFLQNIMLLYKMIHSLRFAFRSVVYFGLVQCAEYSQPGLIVTVGEDFIALWCGVCIFCNTHLEKGKGIVEN